MGGADGGRVGEGWGGSFSNFPGGGGGQAQLYYRPLLWSSQKSKIVHLYYRPPPPGAWAWAPLGGPWLGIGAGTGPGGIPKIFRKSSFPKETFGKFIEILGKFSGISLGGPWLGCVASTLGMQM